MQKRDRQEIEGFGPFGRRIERARRLAGVSQSELAALAGISQSTLSRIEADLVSPALEDTCRIAQALGRPLLYFATGRERSGRDPEDLAVHLRLYGLKDVDTAASPLIGEAWPFEQLVSVAAKTAVPRILEGLPALLLLNDASPREMIGAARKERVLHRIGWLADLADWIAPQVPEARVRPDAIERLREVREIAWTHRQRTRSPVPSVRDWDPFDRKLPAQDGPRGMKALDRKIEDVPPISRKWRMLYETPQEDFLARARDLAVISGD